MGKLTVKNMPENVCITNRNYIMDYYKNLKLFIFLYNALTNLNLINSKFYTMPLLFFTGFYS